MFLISAAHATAPTMDAMAQEPSALAQILPLVLIALVFYFLIIRPQSRRFKDHQKLVAGLRKGDKVVTSGGIVGVVTKVDAEADLLRVEIADGIEVKVVRGMVSSLVSPKPQNDNQAKKAA